MIESYSHTLLGRPSVLHALILLATLGLAGCLDPFVLHPARNGPGIRTWSEQVDRGELRIRLRWARPEGPGPFPAVLVQPGAGQPVSDLEGIVRSLAREGYLALGVDYLRPQKGEYRRVLLPWREPGDSGQALRILRSRPEVDPDRIGLLGFSQGGVFGLLNAAEDSEIRAVVAYYPVADFGRWLEETPRSWGKRQIFKIIRSRFLRESGALTDEEFQRVLESASAIRAAGRIRCPVLLIHGTADTTAPVHESRRMAEALRETGGQVRLLEIPGAGHAFNFKRAAQAREAWEATLEWLDRYVKGAEPHPRLDQ